MPSAAECVSTRSEIVRAAEVIVRPSSQAFLNRTAVSEIFAVEGFAASAALLVSDIPTMLLLG
jgi:hypothetical protein